MSDQEPLATAAELGEWLGLPNKSVFELTRGSLFQRAEPGRWWLKQSIRWYAPRRRAVHRARRSQNEDPARLVGARPPASRSRDRIPRRNIRARRLPKDRPIPRFSKAFRGAWILLGPIAGYGATAQQGSSDVSEGRLRAPRTLQASKEDVDDRLSTEGDQRTMALCHRWGT
jgi:hypothetical protein